MKRYHVEQHDNFQSRREYRRVFEEWLSTLDVNLFVTLSFSQNTRFQIARPLLGQWFARLDNHFLGRGWSRRASLERTFAVAVPENIGTNPHYHCVMRLPAWGYAQPIEQCTPLLDRYWCQLARGGTCDVQRISDLPGLAQYVAKQLVRPGYVREYILASEFHTRGDKKGRADDSR